MIIYTIENLTYLLSQSGEFDTKSSLLEEKECYYTSGVKAPEEERK